MNRQFKPNENSPVQNLEGRMRRLSLVMSLAGLGLMCAGLTDMLITGDPFSLPGLAVVPLKPLIWGHTAPLGIMLASAGVLLLGLLPAVRVVLAIWLFIRAHNPGGTLVAVVVLMELILSIHLGG